MPLPTYEELLRHATRYGRRQLEGLDAATSLATGMAAQVPAGLAGVGRGILELGRGASLEDAAQRAATSVKGSTDALTYEPRTARGQEYVENIGETIEDVKNRIAATRGGQVWEDYTRSAPASAALIAGVADVVGPGKAKPKVKVKPKKKKAAIGTIFDEVTDPEVALAMAQRGEHLKPLPTGEPGYVGAPPQVTSRRALNKTREDADAAVAAGVFNADWYERQRRLAQILSSTPVEQSLFARGTSAYSPQAMPKVELPAFLSQHNEAVLTGNPLGQPRTGSQSRNVAGAYSFDPTTGAPAFNPENIRLGRKTGPYAEAKDPTVPASSLYKTASDIWHGRVMGYGEDFDRGFTPQEHGYLTGENLMLAERARAAGLPIPDPRAAQAATWGSTRFESYKTADAKRYARELRERERYERDPERWRRRHQLKPVKAGAHGPPEFIEKPAAPPKPKPVRSDAELEAAASAGLDTALPRQTATLTQEAIPGRAPGHLGGLIDANDWVKQLYTSAILKATGRRDPTIEGMGLYSRESQGGLQGQYTNLAGEVERQPSWADAVAVSNRNVKGEGIRTPEIEKQALDLAAQTGAYMRGQEVGAWNRFLAKDQSPKVGNMNAARLTDPTPAELKALRAAGLDVMQIDPNTFHVTRFGPEGPIVGSYAEVQKIVPKAERGTLETGYQSGITAKEGTGEATNALIKALRAMGIHPSRLSGRWAEVAPIYNAIDTALSKATGFKLRQDLMKARQIVAHGGLEGLMAHVEKYGAKGLPVVVLGALGLAQHKDESQPGGI